MRSGILNVDIEYHKKTRVLAHPGGVQATIMALTQNIFMRK
jgi:hypothetical protein